MMRDILFRGKREDNGEWVEGYYTKKLCGEYINNQFMESEKDFIVTYFSGGGITSHEVIPATIGQYTGLTDKNGVKIFEGDIIKSHYANAKKSEHIEAVVFKDGKFMAESRLSDTGRCWAILPDGIGRLYQDKSVYMDYCKVMGNIHDNPELLGGDNNV